MEYLPFWVYASVIISFIALFVTVAFDFTAIAEKRCPICKKRFDDVFGLRRHIKAVEKSVYKKAA